MFFPIHKHSLCSRKMKTHSKASIIIHHHSNTRHSPHQVTIRAISSSRIDWVIYQQRVSQSSVMLPISITLVFPPISMSILQLIREKTSVTDCSNNGNPSSFRLVAQLKSQRNYRKLITRQLHTINPKTHSRPTSKPVNQMKVTSRIGYFTSNSSKIMIPRRTSNNIKIHMVNHSNRNLFSSWTLPLSI